MNYDKVPELPDRSVKPVRPAGGIVALAGGLVLVAGVVGYWLSRPAAALSPGQRQRAEEVAVLSEQVRVLTGKLEALPAEAAPVARRRLLEEAVARQRALVRRREPPAAADSVLLEELETRLHDAVLREQEQASRNLEEDAVGLRRQGQVAAAAERLREALRLQREVNRGLSGRQAKNFGREAHLQLQIEELVGEPLLAEARRALAEARTATEAGRWAEAQRHYEAGREAQRRLNAEFPRSRFSDPLVEGRIEAELAALRVAKVQAELSDYLVQAGRAAAEERWEEADRLYGEAAERQRTINTQFPRSRFVSMEQIERIEAERQTLRFAPRLAEVRRQDAAAAVHLRRREVLQARQLVVAAVEALEGAARALPKARGYDEEMGARLNYLARRADDLGAIQDRVYDLLLPLPGAEAAVAMLGTELPQEIYAVVMNDNPSRNPGRALPVDSVTHGEAQEFCRRLGWVLGAEVRLPTAPECARAAGQGFKGITDGLEEWLAAPAADALVAPVLGERGEAGLAPRLERARTRGFRVVVGVDLLAGAR